MDFPLPPRRLVKFNPEVIRSSLKEVVSISVPSLDVLRSFTVKNALTFFQVEVLPTFPTAAHTAGYGLWSCGRLFHPR